MRIVLLPLVENPISVNKYAISYFKYFFQKRELKSISMSDVTYPLYIVGSVHIDKQFDTLNQQNAQLRPWLFILQYHTEYSYMLPSTRYRHEGIKVHL